MFDLNDHKGFDFQKLPLQMEGFVMALRRSA
jgi:hypothetical protein